MSPKARRIGRLVRTIDAPGGARAYIGGRPAELAEPLTALAAVLPWMAGAMATATFVLLFLAFGSVVLPVKAITMNVVSLSAAFGVVTWIFQDGHLSWLLGFTPLGTIEPATPILMFAIIFGLVGTETVLSSSGAVSDPSVLYLSPWEDYLAVARAAFGVTGDPINWAVGLTILLAATVLAALATWLRMRAMEVVSG